MSFTCYDNGIRTSKTVNNVKHSYYLNGSQIVAEQWSDKLIVYLYDATGAPMGMMYRTTAYAEEQWDVFWFEKNLQGDIVAVYNSEGNKVVAYTYSDAWGNHTVSYYNGSISTGVQYNPFRYRGYYYDTDLGMYYLQSRYYDAKIGRFINADGYVSTGQGLTGNNMFAYCGNNPVNRVDPTGEIWFLVAAVVGHIATGINILIAKNTVEEIKAQHYNSFDPKSNPSYEEIINDYLSSKYGAESGIYVAISDSNAQINNGSDVNFRDRMVVSMLLAEEGYTSRSAVSLAAEWEAHNIFDFIMQGTNSNARHVDLDSNFRDNEWYTELGTIICHIMGWY